MLRVRIQSNYRRCGPLSGHRYWRHWWLSQVWVFFPPLVPPPLPWLAEVIRLHSCWGHFLLCVTGRQDGLEQGFRCDSLWHFSAETAECLWGADWCWCCFSSLSPSCISSIIFYNLCTIFKWNDDFACWLNNFLLRLNKRNTYFLKICHCSAAPQHSSKLLSHQKLMIKIIRIIINSLKKHFLNKPFLNPNLGFHELQ